MGRLALLAALLAALGACDRGPSGARLAALRDEANAENARRAASLGSDTDREIREWTLTVEGQTAAGTASTLRYPDLDALATDRLRGPAYTLVQGDDQNVAYRGVRIATLLDRVPPAPGVTEITFVAFDGFRSTIALADARAYAIMLALEADGVRITRSTGGPLFLIFPIRDYPELARTYNWSSWSFYVTRMVLGTDPAALRIGERRVDLAALDALPPQVIEVAPKLRLGWPQGPVRLRGVALADLGVTGAVTIKTKARTWHDVAACAPIVVHRWGPDDALIPARLGGPLVLAFTAPCPAHDSDTEWPTFVEAIEPTGSP